MKRLSLTAIFCISILCAYAQQKGIKSPDGTIEARISLGDSINIQVFLDGESLLRIQDIHLKLDQDIVLGRNTQLSGEVYSSDQAIIKPPVKEKVSEISDSFNELELEFENHFSLLIRLYNEGLAYRFKTSLDGDIRVFHENMEIRYHEGYSAWMQLNDSFRSAYETPYQYFEVDLLPSGKLIHLPVLVKTFQGVNIHIAESALIDYPGMWFRNKGNFVWGADFAGYPLRESFDEKEYDEGVVLEHADYLAETSGTRSFPWRILSISRKDADLLSNMLVYQLADPPAIEDPGWIKPGVVTFDWWAKRNIYGVDFKSGINTETAKYFIDFASEFELEYFLFDDGWSELYDLSKVKPDLDMEEVVGYAQSRNVGIMLWVHWAALNKQLDETLDRFEEWGIKGIKVDFMNRDDQEMVGFYYRVAEAAAKRKMIVDFHGAYKPSGLRRMYPNVLTREALIEFEFNGWTDYVNPVHHNLLPYIRMVCGPMDYIPATVNNAQRDQFRPVGNRPMGMGTRAHAIALFVIFESPLQMLPDSPSDYYRERECMEFIGSLPVEWDELKVFDAKIGQYTYLARRNGDDWYVAAITDWSEREFVLDFSFLEEGDYFLEWIEDGINADTRAIDYRKNRERITPDDRKTIRLVSGGGWVGRIIKR